MTDPSSASRGRRRRSGRHQQQPARRARSTPIPPEEARRNRDAAFGSPNPRRTWIGSSSAPSPQSRDEEQPQEREAPAASPRPRGRRAAFPVAQIGTAGSASSAASAPSSADEGAPVQRPRGRRAAFAADPVTEQDVWSATADDGVEQAPVDAPLAPPSEAEPTGSGAQPTDSGAEPAAALEPASAGTPGPTIVPGRTTSVSGASAPSGASADDAAAEPGDRAARTQGGPAAAEPASGSLPRVAFWTVLTSFVPGSGLVTTRLRRIGWALLAVVLLALVTAGAFLLFGEPLRTGMMLATKRSFLIGVMITVGVVGLVWALQIVLANLAHTTRERLAGTKRYVALALAALMVVGIALPFGRGVQSLWALQGLIGSESVFGGGQGEGGSFASGKDPWANIDRLNIMLLGQDAGSDRTGTRPDTIMVASIDTATGQTALFSIPRNLENVEFPEDTLAAEEFPDGFDYFGRNENLINAVWTWADEHPDLFPGDPEPGLTATRWAVEETLGLEMDYYAMVNLQGFEDLVDALGGVEMVVERRIPIGGGSSKVDGYIEPGDQKLDGFHALWYARSREGSDDFNRMCRQQRIVRRVAEEADPTTLALSIPRLVNATEENIQTDIPVGNLDAFVDLALRIKDGGFTSYPITQDVTFSGNPDFEYLEQWAAASIEDSMKQDPPESVGGETEPGSSEPAETGAPPEEEPAEEPSSEEETSASEEPTDDGTEEGTTPEPEIEKDPLKSCLPGYEG